MLITYERDKLINTLLYFAHETKHLGKIKLFKLLYLLDFEHFRQTGRSVTGLDYQAWKYGPVPVEVMQEWDDPEPDVAAAIRIRPEPVIDDVRETVVPLVAFDDSHFTKRELRIMDELAARYRDTFSPAMIDVTHAENGAWAKIWQDGRGMSEAIPYALGLDPDSPLRESILEIAREREAIRRTHPSHPSHP
ncbi:Panacea domain-containing protein [Thiocapsa sp.]|uniref:Panacea domain-containing protein n=1 Tax=Thiocapsa sp. TaxID=2024551 RepID=UPI003593A988